MRKFSAFLAVITLIAGLSLWTTLHQARASTKEAEAFIQSLGDDVVKVMVAHKHNKPMLLGELNALLNDTIDTDAISRFVVGKHWRRVDDDQKEKFVTSFGPYLINTYTVRFSEYSGETFDISGTREEQNGIILVQSQVVRPSAENVRVDFRVRPQDDGSLKIYDVIIEGVSQLQTQRSEFGSIIERKGIDYLIDRLAKRVKQIQQAKAG